MQKRVIEFINSFSASNDSHGEIIEIEGSVTGVCDIIKEYISKRGIDIYRNKKTGNFWKRDWIKDKAKVSVTGGAKL